MRRTRLDWLSLGILLSFAAPAAARISLPDAVVYGIVTRAGDSVPAGSTVRFVPAPNGVPDDDPGHVLDRASVGELTDAPELFVARIALEQPASLDAPREDGRVRVG